jgi:hypothetical protein
MLLAPLVDFPVLREPPQHVLAGLRAIDPTADLVYFGRGRWLLGSVRPNAELRETSERIYRRALRLLAIALNNPTFNFNPGNARRLFGRVDFAVLGMQGFRFVHEYVVQGELSSAIVHDFAKADWLYRTLTDDAVDALLNAPKEARRQASRADLRDPARARDAHHYVNTVNIAPGISLTPTLQRSSARTLIRSIA